MKKIILTLSLAMLLNAPAKAFGFSLNLNYFFTGFSIQGTESYQKAYKQKVKKVKQLYVKSQQNKKLFPLIVELRKQSLQVVNNFFILEKSETLTLDNSVFVLLSKYSNCKAGPEDCNLKQNADVDNFIISINMYVNPIIKELKKEQAASQ
ncbi:MAG: hypothetical protein HAW60_03025 [Bdellovibrionales bacterium]|nr:hypothetical protein [Bdellovibrionales bacterium]